GGGLASVVGLVLSLVVLTVSNDMAVLQILPALVLIAVVQTTSQTCFQITDASIRAARKNEYLASRPVSYGIAKHVTLFPLVSSRRSSCRWSPSAWCSRRSPCRSSGGRNTARTPWPCSCSSSPRSPRPASRSTRPSSTWTVGPWP